MIDDPDAPAGADTRNTWDTDFSDVEIHKKGRIRDTNVGYDIPATVDPNPNQGGPGRSALAGRPVYRLKDGTYAAKLVDGTYVKVINNGDDYYIEGSDSDIDFKLADVERIPEVNVDDVYYTAFAPDADFNTETRVSGDRNNDVDIRGDQNTSTTVGGVRTTTTNVKGLNKTTNTFGSQETSTTIEGNRTTTTTVHGNQTTTTTVDGLRTTNTHVTTNLALSTFAIDTRQDATAVRADFSARGVHYDARGSVTRTNEQIAGQRSTTDIGFVRRAKQRYFLWYTETRASLQIRHFFVKRFSNTVSPSLMHVREASMKINQDTNYSTRKTWRWYVWTLYQRHAAHIEITAGPFKPDRKTYKERLIYTEDAYNGPGQNPHTRNVFKTLTKLARASGDTRRISPDTGHHRVPSALFAMGKSIGEFVFSPIGAVGSWFSRGLNGDFSTENDPGNDDQLDFHRNFDAKRTPHDDSLAHYSDHDYHDDTPEMFCHPVIQDAAVSTAAIRNFFDFAPAPTFGGDANIPKTERVGASDDQIREFMTMENLCNSPYDMKATLGQRFEYIRRRMSANRDIPAQRGRGELSTVLSLKHPIVPEANRRMLIVGAGQSVTGITGAKDANNGLAVTATLAVKYRSPYDYLRDASRDRETFDAGQRTDGGDGGPNLAQTAAKADTPSDRQFKRQYIEQKKFYSLPEQFWDPVRGNDHTHWRLPEVAWSDKRRVANAPKTEIVCDMENGRWLRPQAYQKNSRILVAVTKPRTERTEEETLERRTAEFKNPTVSSDALKYSFLEINGAGLQLTKLPRIGHGEQQAPYADVPQIPVEGVPNNTITDADHVALDNALNAIGDGLPTDPQLTTLLNALDPFSSFLAPPLQGVFFQPDRRERLANAEILRTPDLLRTALADLSAGTGFSGVDADVARSGFHQQLPEPTGWLAGLEPRHAHALRKIKIIEANDEHGIRLRVTKPTPFEAAPPAASHEDPVLEDKLAGSEGIHQEVRHALKARHAGATLNLANNHASMHFNHAAIVLDDNNAENNDQQQVNSRIKLVSHSGAETSQAGLSSLPITRGNPGADRSQRTTFIELKGNQQIVAKCGAGCFTVTDNMVELRVGDTVLQVTNGHVRINGAEVWCF